MAVISTSTFDPLARYVNVRMQQGVPIVDADLNELDDIRQFELRAFLKWFVGDGVPDGNDDFLDRLLGRASRHDRRGSGFGCTIVVAAATAVPATAPVAVALAMEFGRPIGGDPTGWLKSLPLPLSGPRPLDEAISVAGGIMAESLTPGLELRALPGIFAAGEMLDWEAPTGGYLLTACLASGLWAGRAAARHG